MFSGTSIKDLKRVGAKQNKEQQADKCKSGIVIEEPYLELYFCNLPDEAKYPSKEKNNTDPIQLMMYYPRSLVDLKDECVVYLELPKNVDVDSCRDDYKHDHKSHYVRFYSR